MKAIALTTTVVLSMLLNAGTANATPVKSDFVKDLYYLEVSGIMTVNDQRVNDYTVFLYEDGVMTDSFYIDNRREQFFGCPFGHNYTLRFVKQGYKDRVLLIDTHLPETAQSEDFEFRYQIEFIADDAPSNTFDDFPVAYVMYDKTLDDFDYNKTYHQNVRNNACMTADQTASN